MSLRNNLEALQSTITTMEMQASSRDNINEEKYFPTVSTLILEDEPLEQFNSFAQRKVQTLDIQNQQYQEEIVQLQNQYETALLQQKVTASDLNSQIEELTAIVADRTNSIKSQDRINENIISQLNSKLAQLEKQLFADKKKINSIDIVNMIEKIKSNLNE